MFSTSKEGVMKLNGMIGKDRAGKTFPLTLGWAFSIGGLATALLLALSPILYAQSSPLTVQPSTGRVGVGNTNPGYTLDVTGTVNATGFRGDGSQLTNLPGGGSQWTTNGSNIYYNNGNVGIGTTNPGAKLHISGSGENGLFINSRSSTG